MRVRYVESFNPVHFDMQIRSKKTPKDKIHSDIKRESSDEETQVPKACVKIGLS